VQHTSSNVWKKDWKDIICNGTHFPNMLFAASHSEHSGPYKFDKDFTVLCTTSKIILKL
jgi:hypothetical protein